MVVLFGLSIGIKQQLYCCVLVVCSIMMLWLSWAIFGSCELYVWILKLNIIWVLRFFFDLNKKQQWSIKFYIH